MSHFIRGSPNAYNSSTLLYKRHSTFRKYIQEAIKLDLCQKNPYDDFELKKGHDKERVFLTEEEIKKIQDYNAAGKLYHIKDLFILQCFTGLSYVDLMNLNRNSIEKMGEYKVIRSNRVKTDGSFITLLLPEAEDVLKRYNYRLPRISNQKYNDYLKLLAEVAGVRKNITSHVAKHTFATYLLTTILPRGIRFLHNPLPALHSASLTIGLPIRNSLMGEVRA